MNYLRLQKSDSRNVPTTVIWEIGALAILGTKEEVRCRVEYLDLRDTLLFLL